MSDLSDLAKRLGAVPTAAISGQLYKKYGMRSRAIMDVAPLNPANCRFCGPAYTLRYVPQREDMNVATDLGNPNSIVLKAIEEIAPGSVLVMDMQANRYVGGLGDVLVSGLIARGVAGIVSDGGMRDVREIRDMSLPIFCAGAAAPPSPVSLMPAGVQEMIGCGGVVVIPGDFVVGDEDGVMVVPAHLADDVATQGIEKERLDAWVRSKVEKDGGVRGRYPPDAAHMEMYQAWKAKQPK
jgi:regulator of RNase E activity RraA